MSKTGLKIINQQGLELTVTSEPTVDAHPLMGGDSSNPTWDEYLDGYKEDYREHILLIREAIKQLNWIGDNAEQHANNTAFEFSDGVCLSFSWRAWGDLMQAIIDKQEGYMAYYM